MLVGVLARNQYHNTITQLRPLLAPKYKMAALRMVWLHFYTVGGCEDELSISVCGSHWSYNLGASSAATFKSYLSYAYIKPGWLVTTDPLLSVSINFILMYSNRCGSPSGIFNPFILLSCFSALYLLYISYTEMCCMFSVTQEGNNPLFLWVLLTPPPVAKFGFKLN